MPTYAYRCESCGVEFERYQKFADKPLNRCPECKGKVRRVPQASGIVFKGSGWYVTDSKSSSSTLSKSGKKTETSTETKPTETKTVESTPKPASDD